MQAKHRGFTLVELAVVITVIAILAAVTIVSYGAWQRRMAVNVLKSDLNQAASQLENDLNWKNTYPAQLTEANDGRGLPKSEGTTFDYDFISTNQYCLAASSSRDGVPVHMISSEDTTPREGNCS